MSESLGNNNLLNLKGKRLLICEEALIGFGGHYYSWIKAIRKIHLEAGVEVFVACSAQVDRSIREEFSAFPIYTRNSWSAEFNGKKILNRYFSVLRHNYRLYWQTKKLLAQIGPVDCVIAPSARVHHLIAWRLLCAVKRKTFSRLVLFVLTSEAIYDSEFSNFRFKASSNLIKFVIRSFASLVRRHRVVLAGDSMVTSNEYETLTGVSFSVFPSPVAGLTAAKPAIREKASSVCTFAILGVSGAEKGIDVLQASVLSLLAQEPDIQARFIIQWGSKVVGRDGTEIEISPMLRSASQVLLIDKVLTEKEYEGHMREADFLILPYRRDVYFNRISGVAVEAACAGIPMIVTENTWLHWALEQYGAGLTIKDGSSEDLAEKVKVAIRDRQALKTLAFTKRSVARKLNSTETYLNMVWSLPNNC